MANDQPVPRCVSILEWESQDSISFRPYGLGGTIMIMSLLLFESEFLNIVAISFTALVFNELIMVALEITTWYRILNLAARPGH